MFSCENCKIFKSTYFEEHLQTAASKLMDFYFLWTTTGSWVLKKILVDVRFSFTMFTWSCSVLQINISNKLILFCFKAGFLPMVYLNEFKDAVVQRCSVKKVFIEILQNLQDNTCTRVSFLIKLQALRLCLTLAQVFSYEFCGISNNTFFYRTPLVAASKFVNLNNEKITAQIITQQ